MNSFMAELIRGSSVALLYVRLNSKMISVGDNLLRLVIIFWAKLL